MMKPVSVLIIDDNPIDARFMIKALESINVLKDVKTLSDGEEAMKYLKKQGAYASVERPDLMLLDLKMPRKNGVELLEEMQKDGLMAGITAVVISTSEDDRDIKRCGGLGVRKFITKPIDINEFNENVRSIAPLLEEISRNKKVADL